MRFVVLYEVDRQRYFAIRNWTKHQRVDKPSKPRIPAPPEQETQENPPPREDPTRPSRDTRESFARGQESLAPDLRPPTSDQGARTEPKALTLVRGTVVDGQPLGDWLRAGVAKGYESLKLPAPKETKQITWPKWRELEAWVIEKDRLTGKGDQRETGRQLIRCFLRSPRAAKLGYPITFLVANANEYWRDTLPPALEAAS